MTPAAAYGLLLGVAIYLAAGGILAVPFLIFGIGRIDPGAKSAPWTFRLLVTPGVVALWPFLLRRWLGTRGTR
jgi:hypothetical protein